MSHLMTKPTKWLIWVFPERTVILLVLSWDGSYNSTLIHNARQHLSLANMTKKLNRFACNMLCGMFAIWIICSAFALSILLKTQNFLIISPNKHCGQFTKKALRNRVKTNLEKLAYSTQTLELQVTHVSNDAALNVYTALLILSVKYYQSFS